MGLMVYDIKVKYIISYRRYVYLFLNLSILAKFKRKWFLWYSICRKRNIKIWGEIERNFNISDMDTQNKYFTYIFMLEFLSFL